jgi:hypothetical protein
MSTTASHINPRSLPTPVILGAGMWAVGATATLPGWAPTLLLLAAFVVFPLGLELADAITERRGWMSPAWVAPCAVPLVFSFALDCGVGAAILALPWLMLTAWLAFEGTILLWRAPRWSPSEIGVAATRIFPVVGGVWLVLSRLGARPLDLSDPLVQATAMHFHYAGFALPLLAARLARRSPGRWASAGVTGVLLGVPLVAAGITFTAFKIPFLEAPAAWFLAVACALVAILQWRDARHEPTASRRLLRTSSLMLIAGMALAATYPLGQLLKIEWLDIPWMVRTHGTINAVGFALLGLLGAWMCGGKTNSPGGRQPGA